MNLETKRKTFHLISLFFPFFLVGINRDNPFAILFAFDQVKIEEKFNLFIINNFCFVYSLSKYLYDFVCIHVLVLNYLFEFYSASLLLAYRNFNKRNSGFDEL